jgi:transcriptional regulator GlxA family with amidase domain
MTRSEHLPVPHSIPVYFVILPDTLLLDLAGIAESFRIANQQGGRTVFESRFIGTRDEMKSSIGLGLTGVEPLPPELEDGAWVVVCGMRNPEDAVQSMPVQRVTRWLKRVVGPTQTLCCVCAGALVAAEAGLLDDRQCTSHHDHTAWLEQHHPKARVLHNRIFVRDGNIYTSAGVTSGVDLALMLIAEHAGPVTAARVARDLVVYIRRTAGDPQLSVWMTHRNHLHPVVHRAQDAIVAEPGGDWTLASIAAAACVSVRTLSRLFREETGVTPLDYLEEIRLGVANERLATTRWSMERVAESAGFSSALQLRRAAKRHGAAAPRDVRNQATIQ